jgi:hypothetical protein
VKKNKTLDKLLISLVNGLLWASLGFLGGLYTYDIFSKQIPDKLKDNKLNAGYVIKKKHSQERAYEVSLYEPIKMGDSVLHGKIMVLKDDEDYILQIKRYEEGIVKSRDLFVSKEVFEGFREGGFLDTKKIEYEDTDHDELLSIK